MNCKITYWLMVIGALNWGLVGLGSFFGGNWNVVRLIFGTWPIVESVVYVVVGIAAIISFFSCKKCSCQGN